MKQPCSAVMLSGERDREADWFGVEASLPKATLPEEKDFAVAFETLKPRLSLL